MKTVQLFFISLFLVITSFTFAQPNPTNIPTEKTFDSSFQQENTDLLLKKEQDKLRQNIKRIENSNILPQKELKTTIPKLIEIDQGISKILNKKIKKTNFQIEQLIKELYKFNDFLFNIDMGMRLNGNQRQFFFGQMNTIHYYIYDSVPLPMAQVCLDIAKLEVVQIDVYNGAGDYEGNFSYKLNCISLYPGQYLIVAYDRDGNIYEYRIQIMTDRYGDIISCETLIGDQYRIDHPLYSARYVGNAPDIRIKCSSYR